MEKLKKAPFIGKLLWWTQTTIQEENNQFGILQHSGPFKPVGIVVIDRVNPDETLLKKLGGDWDHEQARNWMSQLAVALHHIHAHGIIYRDLNPSNILLDKEGNICLWEFCNSKRFKFTTVGSRPVGQPAFIAPEVYLKTGYGYGVDIFSMGFIFYHFLAPKRSNFVEETKEAMKELCEKDAANFIEGYPKLKVDDNIPPHAHDLFKRMIIMDPSKRITLQALFTHKYFKGVDWKTLGVLEEKVHKRPSGSFKYRDVSSSHFFEKSENDPDLNLSNYKFEDQTIGSGEDSIVYKGVDLLTKKQVAAKTYSGRFDKENFLQEVKIMNRVRNCPYVCKMIGWKQLNDNEIGKYFRNAIYVCVMEFAANGDLHSALKSGPLDQNKVRKWMSQIVVGLQHIHALGLVHRDIKPGNILLDENENVKICDFGSAFGFTLNESFYDHDEGTKLLLPPETHIGREMLRYSRDIFSLGVTFSMLLNPFTIRLLENQAMTADLKNKYVDFSLPPNALPGSRELYRGMVHPEFRQRFTIKQIMQSEYFEGVDWKELGALEE